MPLADSIDRMAQDYINVVSRLAAQPELDKRYPLMMEPPSALFCDALSVTVVGFRDANSPLDVEVVSDVYHHWTPHALRVIDEMGRNNLQFLTYARTGGPFQVGIQNKKRARVINQRDQLTIERAFAVYTTPLYDPSLIADMMRDYAAQAMYALDQLDADPDLLLVGKPATTGTGWRNPFNDRERMAEHWRSLSPIMRREIPAYYDQLGIAMSRWPSYGAEILLPTDYRGIRMGSRSDADVEVINNMTASTMFGLNTKGEEDSMVPSPTLGFETLVSKTRQVGNDPSSVLFGRGTTPTKWTQDMWQKYSSEYHDMPFARGVIEKYLTTPPAHAPFTEDDDFVILAADWGYQDHAPYMDGSRLIIPDPGRSLGADNIVFQGIQLITSYNHVIYMLESGQPFTMLQYLLTAGQIVANAARSLGITPDDMSILQVGDDMNIRIRKYLISPLLDMLGSWLKLKGMQVDGDWYSFFITGHYSAWRSKDEVAIFVQPRSVKSVSSANMAGTDVPEDIVVGQPYILRPTDEAIRAAAQLAARMPKFLFFHGRPEDWALEMKKDDQFYAGKIIMAADGYSDYLSDILRPEEAPPSDDSATGVESTEDVVVPQATIIERARQDVDSGSKDNEPLSEVIQIYVEDPIYEGNLVTYLQSYGVRAMEEGESADVWLLDAPKVGAIIVKESGPAAEGFIISTPRRAAREIKQLVEARRHRPDLGADSSDLEEPIDSTSEENEG